MDLGSLTSPAALQALGEVVVIDLVLAGDNAVVVGSLAAGLPRDQQKKVILVGIGAALVLRVVLAPVEKDWIEKAKKKGVADPQKLLDELRAEVANAPAAGK